MENLKIEGLDFNKTMNIDEKRDYIKENILPKYEKIAIEKAQPPISYGDAKVLMPLMVEMCNEIFDIWNIEEYNLNRNELLNEIMLKEEEKFIGKVLMSKILRLIPGGVTIISVGLNHKVVKRFTMALGYAVSDLTYSYILLTTTGVNMEIKNVFTREAIEDKMDDFLVEYNKTVTM